MRQWLVDAFADRPFTGNPACVVEPFDHWPDVAWMQALAAENNQSETAFLLRTSDPARFGLRWFTPTLEIPLCGHATLAAAHVLLAELGIDAPVLTFQTQMSGQLRVAGMADGGYEMDFPARPPVRVDTPAGLAAAIGTEIQETWAANYVVAVLACERDVIAAQPDGPAIQAICTGDLAKDRGNIVVTALADPASPYDVVSRFFAPGSGVTEDPVTGSAHCIIVPFWAERLKRETLACFQAFPGRGGHLECQLAGDRVLMRGTAVTVLEAVLRPSLTAGLAIKQG